MIYRGIEILKMNISRELLQELESRLPEIPKGVFQSFTHETDFINIAVQQLDDFHCEKGDQIARIQVKELHQSPYIRFSRPPYVRSTNPELGDLLYIINYFESGQVVERRASIAQAKFIKGDCDRKKDHIWDIPMHQYALLDSLKDFRFDWKGANRRFTISDKNKSLTTYIFASDFLSPFFETVDRMKWYLYDQQSDPTKYTLPRKEPWEVNEYRNRLLSLIKREYGQSFEPGDELYEMIHYMFDQQRSATFTSGRGPSSLIDDSGDPLPDGGEESDTNPMKVVFIDIGLDRSVLDRDTRQNRDLAEWEELNLLPRDQLRDLE